jgi:hypothetical protein
MNGREATEDGYSGQRRTAELGNERSQLGKSSDSRDGPLVADQTKRLVVEKAAKMPRFTQQDLLKSLRKMKKGLIDLGTPQGKEIL